MTSPYLSLFTRALMRQEGRVNSPLPTEKRLQAHRSLQRPAVTAQIPGVKYVNVRESRARTLGTRLPSDKLIYKTRRDGCARKITLL